MNCLKTGELSKRVSSVVIIFFILNRNFYYQFYCRQINPFGILIDSAIVLYDQPPEFFHPASVEEKHKVSYCFLSVLKLMKEYGTLNLP